MHDIKYKWWVPLFIYKSEKHVRDFLSLEGLLICWRRSAQLGPWANGSSFARLNWKQHVKSWPSGLVNLVPSEQSRTFLTDKYRVSNPKAYMFPPSKFSFWIWIKPDRPRQVHEQLLCYLRSIAEQFLLTSSE